MKSPLSIRKEIACVVFALAFAYGCATQPAKTASNSDAQAVALTGTHIPSDVKRSGRITHDTSNVVVIDRKNIDRSGGRTISDVLRADPSTSAAGR
jgi:outer membrane cobalamin receptor